MELINCICGAFLVAIVLASSCQAVRDTQNVLNKLDAFAWDKPGSRLTMEELEKAYQEYESWDSAYREKLIRLSPLIGWLRDFLFHPMERFHSLIGDTVVEHYAYIRRLETNFKKFRKSYYGELVGTRLMVSPKTTSLVESLFDLPGSKPLSAKLLQEAKVEYDAVQTKLGEMSEHEDIYSNLDDFEAFRNYLNWPSSKVLADRVFPLLHTFKEAQYPQLKQFFVAEAKKEGLMVRDGKIIRFAYV